MTDAFITYVRDVRRYSSRTCTLYRSVLENYVSLFGDIPTAENVRGYEVLLMDERGMDPRTVNQHLSVLSGYCRFLVKKGVLKSNPVRTVPRPKMSVRLPEFYREESMKEYFEGTRYRVDGDDMGMPQRYEQRLGRLIVSLLYNTGIRRAELLSLTVSSLDRGRSVLRVKGKGDKMREIPLVPSVCDEISLYLQSVDTMVGCVRTADSPLLVTLKGRALYPVFVDRAVKKELESVPGITGRKSPHVLRHTLATELLSDGADINSIKEFLGHSSLAATQVYTHNSIEKLLKVYDNAHPRAKNGGKNGD